MTKPVVWDRWDLYLVKKDNCKTTKIFWTPWIDRADAFFHWYFFVLKKLVKCQILSGWHGNWTLKKVVNLLDKRFCRSCHLTLPYANDSSRRVIHPIPLLLQSYIFQVLLTLTIYCGTHNWLREQWDIKSWFTFFNFISFLGNKHLKLTWKFRIKI